MEESLGNINANYNNHQKAHCTVNHNNYTIMNEIPINIMWKHQNKSNELFVSNIGPNFTMFDLYQAFEPFGPIKSCNVSVFQNGISKGYGFVQFKNNKSADEAMEKMNGCLIGKQVIFVNKMSSDMGPDEINLVENYLSDSFDENSNLYNLFVRNIPSTFLELDFVKLFMSFGRITRSKLVLNALGISKCYGFICFLEKHCASNAIKALHDKVLNGETKPLYVVYVEKKSERLERLMRLYNCDPNDEHALKTNIYVNNLPLDLDTETLRKLFESFGNVTSLVMLKKNNVNNMAAMINYSNHNSAKNAIETMNGKIIGNKSLSISFALFKQERGLHFNDKRKGTLTNQKYSQKSNMMGNITLESKVEFNDLNVLEQSSENIDNDEVEIMSDDNSIAGPSKLTEPKLNLIVHRSYPFSKYPPLYVIFNKVADINEKWAGKVTRTLITVKKPILEELLLDDDKFHAEVIAIAQEFESNSIAD